MEAGKPGYQCKTGYATKTPIADKNGIYTDVACDETIDATSQISDEATGMCKCKPDFKGVCPTCTEKTLLQKNCELLPDRQWKNDLCVCADVNHIIYKDDKNIESCMTEQNADQACKTKSNNSAASYDKTKSACSVPTPEDKKPKIMTCAEKKRKDGTTPELCGACVDGFAFNGTDTDANKDAVCHQKFTDATCKATTRKLNDKGFCVCNKGFKSDLFSGTTECAKDNGAVALTASSFAVVTVLVSAFAFFF